MGPFGIALIFIVIAVVVVVACIMLYNGIVQKRNRVDNAWQNIDANLQRRNDLIPNLVETVKGYTSHESSTLQAVTEARAAVSAAQTPQQTMEASDQLSGALRQLFAVAEAYPDLKASANFEELQQQLADTENRIVYAPASPTTTASISTTTPSRPSPATCWPAWATLVPWTASRLQTTPALPLR